LLRVIGLQVNVVEVEDRSTVRQESLQRAGPERNAG
jgi:hypothetical protein